MDNSKILVWNVRGINMRARCCAVSEFISQERVWIFRNEVSTAAAIAKCIHDEGSQWIDAGFTPLATVWAFFDNAGITQTSVV
jgi:hypothetical protein